jgi:hypothetical protein
MLTGGQIGIQVYRRCTDMQSGFGVGIWNAEAGVRSQAAAGVGYNRCDHV